MNHFLIWGSVATVIIAVLAIVTAFVGSHRYNEKGRSKIYSRFDEYKDNIQYSLKKEYQRKDICTITHQQIEKRLDKIEEQTALLPGIAAEIKILANGTQT